MTTALVTGATAGIGNAFARRLAQDGHDLVLVARDVERLGRLAERLRGRNGVQVEVLPADLVDRADLDRVADRLRDDERPVDVLVNNAGQAFRGRFVGGDLVNEEHQVDLLIRAVLVLTHAAVPGMKRRGHGSVITTSSVASFLPGGTYSAAKAWATTFTVSLALELRGTGVTATALCPGYVRTEFHGRAGFDMSKLPSWAWLDADRLVAECLRDVRRGRAVSVPSRRYRLAVAGLRHLPLRTTSLAGRQRLRMRDRDRDRD
jgi:short-subunit dehydrogenase